MTKKTDKDWAKQALSLMDLTTLEDDDTHARVENLCQQASTDFGHTAAVCVYAQFAETAKCFFEKTNAAVKVATVANFPHGNADIEKAVQDVDFAVANRADEVDVVLPYQSLMQGNEAIAAELVANSKAACKGKLLKVIIESGELKQPDLIRRASEIAIENGADFIKTSTGKVPVNATLEAAEIMLNVIKDSGKAVGFKAAGGVRSLDDAKSYLQLAEKIMGENWVTPATFRFGASGLLSSLLATLNDESASDNSSSY